MGKRLLAICDTPTVHTGFGMVALNVLSNLRPGWDIDILGINYYGDPHPLQKTFNIYNPSVGGDVYGFGRIKELVTATQYDLVWILNDVWLCADYVQSIRKHAPNVPIVLYTPIDAPNIKPVFVEPLNNATKVVTYTDFGKSELVSAGFKGDITVIPHGVDLKHFSVVPKIDAKRRIYGAMKINLENMFTVLYVGRNQPRKRIDLAIYTIAKWLEKYPHDNVYFHYHGALKDVGIDVEDWAKACNIHNRLILTSRELTPTRGLPIEHMKYLYSASDIYFHACAVEGWGMPLHEAMACGATCLVPEYSALAEWPRGAVEYCAVDPTPDLNFQMVNTVHRHIDVSDAIEKLEYLYQNKDRRDEIGKLAREKAQDQKFQWRKIGHEFDNIFKEALTWKQTSVQTQIKPVPFR